MYLENEVLVREKLRGKILLPNNLENSYKTEKILKILSLMGDYMKFTLITKVNQFIVMLP